MPVYKFRSVEAMEDPRRKWRSPGDPALDEAIARVWARAAALCAPRFPPGVYRHRSIDAANRLRETWRTHAVA
jgi:hypothetical protein